MLYTLKGGYVYTNKEIKQVNVIIENNKIVENKIILRFILPTLLYHHENCQNNTKHLVFHLLTDNAKIFHLK